MRALRLACALRAAPVIAALTLASSPAFAKNVVVQLSGKNGPVAVPLAKGGDGGWSLPPGAKLTDDQYKAFQAGELYVNVHSAAHPDGEIRGQLKP